MDVVLSRRRRGEIESSPPRNVAFHDYLLGKSPVVYMKSARDLPDGCPSSHGVRIET